MLIEDFNAAKFLAEYWQKKPCLIKGFVADFVDPIDEHDLAGLSQEDDVDSRIVTKVNDKWRVSQGPFREFDEYCVGAWSLLVQGVDRYFEEVNQLTELIKFLPNWRFDDVMVSYSIENAGVGAHIDQYDVFIVQGKGTRRWQVGLPEKRKTLTPHPLLKQISDFTPVIDEVLQPGDAIYIPPKHPHRGVALEPCLNYSLGFRAPTNVDVLNGVIDCSEGFDSIQKRYEDPNINKMRNENLDVSEVATTELSKLKQSLLDLLNTPEAEDALLKYLSIQQLPFGEHTNEDQYLVSDIEMFVQNKQLIHRSPGVRPIYIEQQFNIFTFFIDGNAFEIDIQLQEQTKELLLNSSIDLAQTVTIFENTELAAFDRTLYKSWLSLVCTLLNYGYWHI